MDITDHYGSNLDCRKCWKGYPVPCQQLDCKGLVHAVFGDYIDWDNFYLETKCDVCGKPEK